MKLFLIPIALFFWLNCDAQDSTSKDKRKKLTPRAIGIDEEGLEEPAENDTPRESEDVKDPKEEIPDIRIVTPDNNDQSVFLDSIPLVTDPTNIKLVEMFTEPTVINPLYDEDSHTSPYGSTQDFAEMDQNKEQLRELERKYRDQEQKEEFPLALILQISGGILLGAFLVFFGVKRMRGK